MSLNLVSVQQVLASFRDEMGRPELMIVGSLSLHLNGFDVEVNDIDLEYYYPSSQSLEKLKFLTKANPSGIKNYSDEGNKRYDFIYQGIKFNVWVKSLIDMEVVEVSEARRHTWWNYYKVSNVISTVKAMRQQGRNKDYKNVMGLINQILND